MTPNSPEAVVLCEGYHDRAFWSGWLCHLGCRDLRSLTRRPVKDPQGLTVAGGQYAFASISERFIRVVPVRGRGNMLPDAIDLIARRSANKLDRLVVCIDPDVKVSDDVEQPAGGLTITDLLRHIQTTEPAAKLNPNGDIHLSGDDALVSLIRWEVKQSPVAGVPEKQSLERLVCTAIRAAYPNRAAKVQAWLDSRDDPPLVTNKEHAWSYYAGWHTAHGTEDFYRCLWDDPSVASLLRSLLEKSGAWRVAEQVAA